MPHKEQTLENQNMEGPACRRASQFHGRFICSVEVSG